MTTQAKFALARRLLRDTWAQYLREAYGRSVWRPDAHSCVPSRTRASLIQGRQKGMAHVERTTDDRDRP